MNILRAPSHEFVEAIRNELAVLPKCWSERIDDIPWILLQDSISPVWTGVMINESIANDGRKYSGIGGWYCPLNVNNNWRFAPHIFLKPKSLHCAVHEAAHAIEDAIHAPVSNLFEPEKALYPYMASNEDEFFACAVDAFLRHPDDERWNIEDLMNSGAEIYDYLRTQLS